tara:strand:- start:111 stop:1211 length:1101 start_codon:yes stop_codon:yes gene_type:complete
MAFSGYGGLERREQEKDKAKAALAAQLAANEEWDRRNKLQFEDSLNLKFADLAIKNGSLRTNGMVSGNGKDSETGMTNSEARNALIKNYMVEDENGNLVKDPNFMAAIAEIDGTEDPKGFIKLYSVLNPYIAAMKEDSQNETFIGDMVRKEVISVVSKASMTAPNPEKPGQIIANIEDNILNSKLDERTKQMLMLGIPTGGSFNIPPDSPSVYVPTPSVEDITEFEKFVVKPVESRAIVERGKILSLMGSLAKKKEKGQYDDKLTEWYTKRLGDIDRAIEFAEKEKNYGLYASLYSNSFLEKAENFYGNMTRVKDLMNPLIVTAAKTPIYVANEQIAMILQRQGILFEDDIVYLMDKAELARMPKQ